MEQVLHRIRKEAQKGSAYNAGMKDLIPKGVKARKVGSVKGMKAEACARVEYKFEIGSVGEGNLRDQLGGAEADHCSAPQRAVAGLRIPFRCC